MSIYDDMIEFQYQLRSGEHEQAEAAWLKILEKASKGDAGIDQYCESSVLHQMYTSNDMHECTSEDRILSFFRALPDEVKKEVAGIECADHISGGTLLMMACREGHAALVKALLAVDRRHDRVDAEGDTAVLYALLGESRPCLDLLVSSGADIDYQNKVGNTALIRVANIMGVLNLVELAIEVGMSPFIRNKNGETALDIAEDKGHKEIVGLLRDYEARLCSEKIKENTHPALKSATPGPRL